MFGKSRVSVPLKIIHPSSLFASSVMCHFFKGRHVKETTVVMSEKLYYRPGQEHRAPAPKQFYVDAWVEVCDIPQHQAEEQFAEAVAYGDIREYVVKTDETATPQSGAPAGVDYSHDCRCDKLDWADGCGFNSCPRRKQSLSHMIYEQATFAQDSAIPTTPLFPPGFWNVTGTRH